MLMDWKKVDGLVARDVLHCRRIVKIGQEFFALFATEVNRRVQEEKGLPKGERRPKNEIRKEVLDEEILAVERAGGDKAWPRKALALRAFKVNGMGAIEQLPMNKAARMLRLVSPMAGNLSKKCKPEEIKALLERAKGLTAEEIKLAVDKLLSAKKAKPFWGQAAAKLSIENENSFVNEIAFFNALGRDDAWRLAEVLVAKCEKIDADKRAAADAAKKAADEAAQQTEGAPVAQPAELVAG